MGTQIVIHQNTLKIPPDFFNGIGTWCDLCQKSLYDNMSSFDVLQPIPPPPPSIGKFCQLRQKKYSFPSQFFGHSVFRKIEIYDKSRLEFGSVRSTMWLHEPGGLGRWFSWDWEWAHPLQTSWSWVLLSFQDGGACLCIDTLQMRLNSEFQRRFLYYSLCKLVTHCWRRCLNVYSSTPVSVLPRCLPYSTALIVAKRECCRVYRWEKAFNPKPSFETSPVPPFFA